MASKTPTSSAKESVLFNPNLPRGLVLIGVLALSIAGTIRGYVGTTLSAESKPEKQDRGLKKQVCDILKTRAPLPQGSHTPSKEEVAARLAFLNSGEADKEIKKDVSDTLCLLKKMGYPEWYPEGKPPEGADPDSLSFEYKDQKYIYVPERQDFLAKSHMDSVIQRIKEYQGVYPKKSLEVILKDMSAENFLSQKLACVRDAEHHDKCLLTRQQIPCMLLKSEAEAVTLANQEMYDKTHEQIKFATCNRSSFEQGAEVVIITGQGCDSVGKRGVLKPGTSHHGDGTGFDADNAESARRWLFRFAGVSCNFITTKLSLRHGIQRADIGHCSFGEAKTTGLHALADRTRAKEDGLLEWKDLGKDALGIGKKEEGEKKDEEKEDKDKEDEK